MLCHIAMWYEQWMILTMIIVDDVDQQCFDDEHHIDIISRPMSLIIDEWVDERLRWGLAHAIHFVYLYPIDYLVIFIVPLTSTKSMWLNESTTYHHHRIPIRRVTTL
jgi:hypothetical protein